MLTPVSPAYLARTWATAPQVDGTFGSIRELVDHHRAHRVPVTLLSGAILVSPVHKADTSNEPPPPIVSRAKKSSAPKPPEDLEDYEWFHGKLERADAKHLLRRVGDYLVRESTKKEGELAVRIDLRGAGSGDLFAVSASGHLLRRG